MGDLVTSCGTILEKWSEALGGKDELARIHSVRFRNEIDRELRNGITICGTREIWITSAGNMRTESHITGGTYNLYVLNQERRQGWTIGADDRVVPLVGNASSKFVKNPHLRAKLADAASEKQPPRPTGSSQLGEKMTEAFLLSWSYLLPDRMKGSVELEGEDAEGTHYVLRMEPEGGQPVQAFVDKTSFRPQRFIVGRDTPTTITFEKWRVEGGVLFPCRSVRTREGEGKETVTLEELGVNIDIPEGTFEQPEEHEPLVEFRGSTHGTTVPIEMAENSILVRMRINGHGPFWFGLDTGTSASVIDSDTARRIGLTCRCTFAGILGGGTDETRVNLVDGATIELGDVKFHNHNMMAINLDAVAHQDAGRPVDGILGGTFIRHFVLDIDYAAKRLYLHDPAHFEPPADENIITIDLSSGVPMVNLTLNAAGKELQGKFMIDTGAEPALIINSPFMKESKALQSVTPTVDTILYGVSGEAKMTVGRLREVSLGDFSLEDVVTEFSQAKEGSLASSKFDGFLGSEVLRRFSTTFDYAGRRLILKPNADYDEPYEFDMSGVVVVSEGDRFDTFRIRYVTKGSPADEIGLCVDDLITSVDDVPASKISLPKLHEMFRNEGARYALGVRRGSEMFDVHIDLRELI